MIWMVQDDVMSADGMVMYKFVLYCIVLHNLSVLDILSATKSVS